MKNSILLGLIMFLAISVKAQYFVPTLDATAVTTSKVCIVETMDGKVLTGTIPTCMGTNGALKRFTLKTMEGETLKLIAADVKSLKVKPSKYSKIASILSQPDLGDVLKDFESIVDREWVYYEQALLNAKKGKYGLMQLLNPGFDSKIKVYEDPGAEESMGSKMTFGAKGSGDKSYIVAVGDAQVETYEKKRYAKESVKSLYKDCKVFLENYGGDKFQWKNFAEHVYVYDQLCY